MKKQYGLIGKNIGYSFSRGYFGRKFEQLQLNDTCDYCNFDLQDIREIKTVFDRHKNNLCGMNVTIPYKQVVIPFLDGISPEAQKIGAVNTIAFNRSGKKIGYNTDIYGFEKSLQPLLKPTHKKGLILGTGGASKAVAFVFERLGIDFYWVSRNAKNTQTITYKNLNADIIKNHTVIVNCSPVGTFPNITASPEIPYNSIGEAHILYDLIYNPEKTAFLKEGIKRKATVKNGLEMLALQAEKSWEIWQQTNEL